MRRHAFDWKPIPRHEWGQGTSDHFNAPLENGDELHIYGQPEATLSGSPGPTRWHSEVIPGHGTAWPDPNNHWYDIQGESYAQHLTPEDARAHAEDFYKQHAHTWDRPGSHSSGVDYSDLNAFKDYL